MPGRLRSLSKSTKSLRQMNRHREQKRQKAKDWGRLKSQKRESLKTMDRNFNRKPKGKSNRSPSKTTVTLLPPTNANLYASPKKICPRLSENSLLTGSALSLP